uniref:hypothetical protein n=1 Tax=uncultured Alistipes sp. TaxID=538949 RepID=UPI00259B6255
YFGNLVTYGSSLFVCSYSLSLRHVESQEATAIGQILQDQILAGFFLFGGIVKTSAEKALKQVAEYPNRYLKTLHPIR